MHIEQKLKVQEDLMNGWMKELDADEQESYFSDIEESFSGSSLLISTVKDVYLEFKYWKC